MISSSSKKVWLLALLGCLVVVVITTLLLAPSGQQENVAADTTTPATSLEDHSHEYPGEFCGTPSPTEEEKASMQEVFIAWEQQRHGHHSPTLDSPNIFAVSIEEPYTVPVYMHVMAQDESTGIVNDAKIEAMMNALSAGYQGAGFTFELAGRETTFNADWFNCSDISLEVEKEFKTALKQGDTNSLNIYLCQVCPAKPCRLGFSTYPKDAGSLLDGAGA
jgi:hypothetical protein